MKNQTQPGVSSLHSPDRNKRWPSPVRSLRNVLVAPLSALFMVTCSQGNGITDNRRSGLNESTLSKTATPDHVVNDEPTLTTDPRAAQVVEQALEAHGSRKLIDHEVAFTFRDNRFRVVKRSDGRFRYERTFENDDHQTVHDVLTNAGPERYIDGELQPFDSDKQKKDIAEAVNSVVYFTTLPLPLTDGAVRLSDRGQETIDSEDYDRIEVRFVQEGGGTDHDDVFVYWFHAEKHTLDYLGYSYTRDDGGLRFRVAKNRVHHKGIVFQDYDNYSPEGLQAPVMTLADLHRGGSLCEVSVVENSEFCIAELGSGERCN